MKPPKILPCPSCRSADGPGILEGISTSCFKKHSFRVGCPCGRRGPRAVTVRRAIEVWNDEASGRSYYGQIEGSFAALELKKKR